MKVLQVINGLGTGGAEKLLLESIPLYNANGVTTDLLLLDGTNHPFLNVLKKTNSCAIFSLGTGSVYNPLLLFKIIPFLKKYDVVHVHLFPALYWVSLAKIISFSKVKLIYTEHSTTNRRRKSFFFKIADKIIYKSYNKIVAITQEVKQALEIHLSKENNAKFEVIANGVNLKVIKTAKALNKNTFFKDEDAIILIQVARFFEPKDPVTLIKSLTLLPENVKLLLVGEGNLKASCEALVIDLNLQERVLFLGVRMDVPELLKTSDIIVLSSHYEGLSLSCVEGLASGKPFIASDVPGLSDIVKDAGLLFPKNDFKTLAKIIENLLVDKLFYNKTVASCQERAVNYDIIIMVKNYIKLYESIQ